MGQGGSPGELFPYFKTVLPIVIYMSEPSCCLIGCIHSSKQPGLALIVTVEAISFAVQSHLRSVRQRLCQGVSRSVLCRSSSYLLWSPICWCPSLCCKVHPLSKPSCMNCDANGFCCGIYVQLSCGSYARCDKRGMP